MKLDLHHKLFFTWLLWAAIGAIGSQYPVMAFQGFYPYRCEGLLTWIIITSLAYSYWQAFDSIDGLSWICVMICLALGIIYFLKVPTWEDDVSSQWKALTWFEGFFLPGVAIASFACLAGILIMKINPLMSAIALLPILNASNRSSLMALTGGGMAFLLFRYGHKLFNLRISLNFTTKEGFFKKWGLVIIASIILFSVIMEKSYNFEQKIEHLPKFSHLGLGARSQWMLQGANLSFKLPLTGYGLDTLSEYLKSPTGQGYEGLSKFIPDRTHNLAMDLILQTGWIGYTLILLSFGYALGIFCKFPNKQNLTCLCALISFIIFNCLNPAGLLAESVALICLFGIRRTV